MNMFEVMAKLQDVIDTFLLQVEVRGYALSVLWKLQGNDGTFFILD